MCPPRAQHGFGELALLLAVGQRLVHDGLAPHAVDVVEAHAGQRGCERQGIALVAPLGQVEDENLLELPRFISGMTSGACNAWRTPRVLFWMSANVFGVLSEVLKEAKREGSEKEGREGPMEKRR